MATAVFVFHPNFAASTVNARLAAEAEKQDGVTVRRLYDLYPDFRIDVAAEQAALTASDRIVLQFPMYWYSCPPLLKKWEDDVLTYGWAYGPTGDALHGKEMVVAVSPGAPGAAYRRDGAAKYEVTELLRPFQATSNLIGTTFAKPFVTAGAVSMSAAELDARAAAYAAYITSDSLEPLGDYE